MHAGGGAMRSILALLAIGVFLSDTARADTCLVPGQRPMTVVQLFFGQTVPGKGRLSAAAWDRFLQDVVTLRFPDGFTVLEGYGQWRAPGARRIGRERSKVIEIAAESSPELSKKVEEIAAAYRTEFQQQSVGIVTFSGCGVF